MSSQPDPNIVVSSRVSDSKELQGLPERILVTGRLSFDDSTEQWYLCDISGEDGISLNQERVASVCFGKRLSGFSGWQTLLSGVNASVVIRRRDRPQYFSPVHRTLRIIYPYSTEVSYWPDAGPLTIDQAIYRYSKDKWKICKEICLELEEVAKYVNFRSSADQTSLYHTVLEFKEQVEDTAKELNDLERERDEYVNSIHARREELGSLEAVLRELKGKEQLARKSLSEIHELLASSQDIAQGGECDTKQLHQLVSNLRSEVKQLLDRKSTLTPEVAELQETQRNNLTEHKRLVNVLSGLRMKALSNTSKWLEMGWITEDDQNLLLGGAEGDVSVADEGIPSDWPKFVENVHSCIFSGGLLYPKHLILNVLSLICTHDIVIFAGEPGCGKTALVRAIADALGASKPAVIAVKPNWTSSEDLFGYWNAADGYFVSTVFTDALRRAAIDKDRLHFVCLDELNLARVEYYFADLLSAFEDRTKCPRVTLIPESIGRTPSEEEKAVSSNYRYLDVPENVRIIGCINMDETTHAFSSKILDRVHVVRFPNPLDIDMASHNRETKGSGTRIPLHPSAMPRRQYPELELPSKTAVESHLARWRPLLERMGIQLSLRVVRQAMNYRNCLAMMMGEDSADWVARNYTVLQKILPRLEHDSPDQEDSDQRHRAVGEFLRALRDLDDKEESPVGALDFKVPKASVQLQKMYEDAERRPDKQYRYW